jgi:hypothetical protein
LQNDKLINYSRDSYEHYFYSMQGGTSNLQGVTLVVNQDYQFVVYYLLYSNDGRLQSKFAVAGSGGDGLFSHASFAEFVNDSTCLRTTIAREYSTDADTIPIRMDSTFTTVVIRNNGMVNEQP